MHGLGYGTNQVYAKNIGLLKRYSDHEYRLIHMKTMRLAGFEEQHPLAKGKKGSAGNSHKLEQSLSRSKSRIRELATCNPWEYFVTLTISPERFNRHDLGEYQRQLSKWLNNMNSRSPFVVKYLFIPEPHKDGAWHIHGLLMGLPVNQLTPFTLADSIPERVKKLLREGHSIYNWTDYASHFGWVTVEPILHRERCASYITKYITKELQASSIALNHHLYYASKGLSRAELIYRGDIRQNFEPDFSNDYVRVKSFQQEDEALQYFCDREEI